MTAEKTERGACPARPLPKPGKPPYTDCWSEEGILTPDIVLPRRGIALENETVGDRDKWGVLWACRALKPGRGKPLYGTVHTQRQRAVMRRFRCHVCNESADRNGQGTLWVIEDRRGDWEDWPEGCPTVHPPLCLSCAPRAIRECHYLNRTPWVVLRVRNPQIVGVYGMLHQPIDGVPVPVRKDFVRYDVGPALRWIVATQLACALHDCTLLDPAVLAA